MGRPMPAWSLRPETVETARQVARWPARIDREWAWGGSTGAGVRVCILDSGIEPGHPMVGPLERAVSVGPDGEIVEDTEGDVAGHGTACAGIVRALAPDCALTSVRVLGAGAKGSGNVLLAGLRWAIDEGYHLVNLSLSTTKGELLTALHEAADMAYFRRTVLVASAHNMPVESYPWRFASVISVGTHGEADPWAFYVNPDPPVEFFARGLDVDVAWSGGGTLRCSGNSFATPHVTGIAALVLAKHPALTPFELKSALYLTASNVEHPE